MKYSSILIIEDHPMVGSAMSSLVEIMLPNYNVVLADSAEAGFSKARLINDIRLILMDFNLPGMSGSEAIHMFMQRYPKAKLIVISGSDDRYAVSGALRAGAAAFISKSVDMEVIRTVIRRALSGAMSAPEWVTAKSYMSTADLQDSTDVLTARQREVMTLLMAGHSNKEIGLRLNLAEVTVKMHVSAIFKTLKVVNRTQAVTKMHQLGLDLADNRVPLPGSETDSMQA
jgi:two-component system, NarL family, nitrate/nitrite response regulator NarL